MLVHVFVGPTLTAAQVTGILPDGIIHPPIAHGDLLRLDLRPGQVAVIIDGFYHHAAPVRHKEILSVLASGVIVVGCASMGALRAAELCTLGMIGNGTVYSLYRDGVIDSDEEVAITHGDPPEYRRFSEPLVNVRIALAAAVRDQVIGPDVATVCLDSAAATAYPARRWRTILAGAARAGVPHHCLDDLTRYLDEHAEIADAKAADALDTLRRLPALVATADVKNQTWARSDDWRNRHLYDWCAEFADIDCGDMTVGRGEVIRYHQLYAEAFVRRWRRTALESISGSVDRSNPDGPAEYVESQALSAAALRGISSATVTPDQSETWLTAEEITLLDPREAMLRILVRSFRPVHGMRDLLAAVPDAATDDVSLRAVAESQIVNEQVAVRAPGQRADRLKTSLVLKHLSDTWRVPEDDSRALLAAARDRGFPSLADAVEAARPFFLRHRLLATSTGTSG